MKLRLLPKKWRFRLRRKGGAGSGNWGHTGRPGLVGGSGGKAGATFKLDISQASEEKQQQYKRGLFTEDEMVKYTGQQDEYEAYQDALKDSPDFKLSSGTVKDNFSTSKQEQLANELVERDDWHLTKDETLEMFDIEYMDAGDIVTIGKYLDGDIEQGIMLQRAFGLQQQLEPRDYEFSAGVVRQGQSSDVLDNLLDNKLPVSPSGQVETWDSASMPTRSYIKKEIMNDLADRTGVDPREVSNVIEQWAHSSNDTDMRSLAIQKDASEEFGVPLSQWQQLQFDNNVISKSMSNSPDSNRYRPLLHTDTQKQIIRAVYDSTQERFASQGLGPDDTVRMYRGVVMPKDTGWNNNDVVNYSGNTMESWSSSADIAASFATGHGGGTGYTIAMDVPVRNIVSTPRTGFGCLVVGEFVIIGSITNQQALILETYQ